MKALLSHIRNFDWILLGGVFLLAGFGLLLLFSIAQGRGDFSFFYKQFTFVGIGMGLMIVVSLFDWRLIRNNPYLILTLYFIGVIALALLLLPKVLGPISFIPETRGTYGWYRIGGISVDPIEYVKIVLLILMAKYFSSRHIEIYRLRHIFISGIYFALPILFIFLQPDLGPAVLFGIVWIALLLIAGIRISHLVVLLFTGILLALLSWQFFLHDYQRERVLSFLEPGLDPLGIGWSQAQSQIAIGSGGLFGQGIGNGTQTQLGFLSEPHTDFIFAALAEEAGMLGIVILFAAFWVVIWRIVRIGYKGESNFSRLFAVGFAIILLVQASINIGMNLGLLPIVGLPLPFVSYGGSFLLMAFVGLGILQSIRTH